MSLANYGDYRRPLSTAAINRDPACMRRSRRVGRNDPVTPSAEDRQKCAFTVPARATDLNKHGAAIQLNRELVVGPAVTVQNTRGSHASVRVVAQVSAAQGVHTYGIEFLEDGGVTGFWGIIFPYPQQGPGRNSAGA